MSLLGIDLGTSGCKAVVFRESGNVLAQAAREYGMLRAGPGRAELDSELVWQKVKTVIREAVAACPADPVTALCVSSFGEAVLPLSRERRLLGSSILSMDQRGGEYVERLESAFDDESFYRINPNIRGVNYSLPKLMWLRDHEPDLFEQTDYFLLWADAAAFLLGADAVASNSLANRTLLFDLSANDWSDELLSWSQIPREKLGRIVPGGEVIGTLSKVMAAELGLPDGVAIVSGAHDQCCNALGCGGITAGRAVTGIGTYECITPIYAKPDDSLDVFRAGMNIEHHILPDLYVSFIFHLGGSLVSWFRQTFAPDVSFAELDAELPDEPSNLLVLPHFEPPVSPRPIPQTTGMICGLRTSTTRGEIFKAVLEGESFHLLEGMDQLKAIGIATDSFVVSGGGAKSDAWVQIKADLFGVPFMRPSITEGTAAGAAMAAGLATGVWTSPEQAVAAFLEEDRWFEPDPGRHARYRERAELFKQLHPNNAELLRRLFAL